MLGTGRSTCTGMLPPVKGGADITRLQDRSIPERSPLTSTRESINHQWTDNITKTAHTLFTEVPASNVPNRSKQSGDTAVTRVRFRVYSQTGDPGHW